MTPHEWRKKHRCCAFCKYFDTFRFPGADFYENRNVC